MFLGNKLTPTQKSAGREGRVLLLKRQKLLVIPAGDTDAVETVGEHHDAFNLRVYGAAVTKPGEPFGGSRATAGWKHGMR